METEIKHGKLDIAILPDLMAKEIKPKEWTFDELAKNIAQAPEFPSKKSCPNGRSPVRKRYVCRDPAA